MRRRRQLSATDRAALWTGWRQGLSLSEIARGLDRRAGTIFNVIRRGYAPRPRRRAPRALQAAEREEISRGIAAQLSIRSIARKLQRTPSTISREIGRNGGRQAYRAGLAERQAWERARRPQCCLLARRPRLRQWVARQLRRDWSP